MISDKPPSSAAAKPPHLVIGRLLWAAILIAGLAVWLFFVLRGDSPRAWRAMLINFLFFTPLNVGMVVWVAVVWLCRGRWMGPFEHAALAGSAFAPVSISAFIALWFGRSHWAVWIATPNPANAAWLNESFVFIRDGGALLLMWALLVMFVRRRRIGPPKIFAGWLVVAYSLIFSLLGFDMVMALDPQWFSSLFGGYFLISSMYIAAAGWAVSALARSSIPDKNRLHDLGKLIVAMSLLTTYMMYSQLIVIWYENLPSEVRFVIPRMAAPPWRWVSMILLAVVYLGPLVYMLTRWSKMTPKLLGGSAMAVLAGMWLERWWLVTPTLGGEFRLGLVELSLTAAFAAATVLTMGQFYRRSPVEMFQSDKERL